MCMLGLHHIYASHIIGGDIYYSLSHYNQDSSLVTYDIEFILYRDTAGLDFDILAEFGVYRKQANQDWESFQVFNDIPLDQILEISALDDPCKDEILSQLIIESGIYKFQVTLETGPFMYMVAHQRCCRNFTINNILNPGETGAVYDIIITPEAMKLTNSSPVFREYPPIFVCLGFDFDFDHRAIDVEGDSLVYKLCTPFISGTNPGNPPAICCDCVKPDPRTCTPNFDEVIYTNGFNRENPVGGDPQIRIHPKTGRISGIPNILGSFVVGVCVDEYRDGVLLGSYRRDFEFNVEACTPRVYAELMAEEVNFEVPGFEGLAVYTYESCEDEIDLINLSIEEEFITDYKWLIYNESDELVFSEQGLAHRDVHARLDGPGMYSGFMILNDQMKCVDTALMLIEIYDKPVLDFDVSFDPCAPGPITFVNNSLEGDHPIEDWTWTVDGIAVSNEQNIEIQGTLPREYDVTLAAIDLAGCRANTREERVIYNPSEVHAELASEEIDFEVPGLEGVPVYTFASCEREIDLVNLSREEEFISDYKWMIYAGDDELVYVKQGSEERDASLVLDGPGIYHGFMVINDQMTCPDTAYLQIEVSEKPSLDFDVSFDPCVPGPITFVNTSVNVENPIASWTWMVDGITVADTRDTEIFGDRPREYAVGLEAINASGCSSKIEEDVLYDRWAEELRTDILDTLICEGDTVVFGGEIYWAAGSHDRFYTTVDGCDSLQRIWEVEVRDSLEVTLVSDDSVRIFLETRIELEVDGIIDDIRWTPADGLSCDDCLDPTVILEEDQTYLVQVTDDIGCTAFAQFDIFVDPNIDFYVPNVLMTQAPVNPVNEFFFLHVDPVFSFQYNLTIYDRWGSEVFHRKRLTTNVADDGWSPDPYMTGVYVYYIEIMGDVDEPVLAGDVTVIR